MNRNILFILLSLFLVSSCHLEFGRSETQTFTDDYGRTVVIPSAPKRIVSLSPAVTEIVCALGGSQLLVGRTDFCAYPETVLDLPSVGGITNLNVEQVVGMNPDVVIGGSMLPQKSVLQLEKMNVAVVCVPEKEHFDDLYSNIEKIGKIIGREKSADSLNALLRAQVNALDTTHASHRPTAYYVVGYGAAGNYTAGGNTYINDIISLAGGRNIAADVQGWSYSMEALMHEDPDYLIIRAADSAAFVKTAPYTQLTAVRQGRVIAIESGCIDLQVPRNIQAVVLLNRFFAQ